MHLNSGVLLLLLLLFILIQLAFSKIYHTFWISSESTPTNEMLSRFLSPNPSGLGHVPSSRSRGSKRHPFSAGYLLGERAPVISD